MAVFDQGPILLSQNPSLLEGCVRVVLVKDVEKNFVGISGE